MVDPSSDINNRYTQFRKKIKKWIRESKKDDIFRKIGKSPFAKIFTKPFKQLGNSNSHAIIFPTWKHSIIVFIRGTAAICKVKGESSSTKKERNWKKIVPRQTDQLAADKIPQKMKNKKNSAPDGISDKVLKLFKCCSPVFESFIACAFNQCQLKRTDPENLKTAKVLPSHKKCYESNPENWKPINLLNSMRIFWKKFCDKNKLLSSAQYGFRAETSCIDAFNQVTECTDYMGAKLVLEYTGHARFIDLSKAFDTLDHWIL